jgi:hypothetical protein
VHRFVELREGVTFILRLSHNAFKNAFGFDGILSRLRPVSSAACSEPVG